MTVGEEAGRSGKAPVLAFGGIRLDGGCFGARVKASVELCSIQLKGTCFLFEICRLQLLVHKKLVVELPEFALHSRATRGFSSLLCVWVHGKREILVGNCQFVTELFVQFIQLHVYFL